MNIPLSVKERKIRTKLIKNTTLSNYSWFNKKEYEMLINSKDFYKMIDHHYKIVSFLAVNRPYIIHKLTYYPDELILYYLQSCRNFSRKMKNQVSDWNLSQYLLLVQKRKRESPNRYYNHKYTNYTWIYKNESDRIHRLLHKNRKIDILGEHIYVPEFIYFKDKDVKFIYQ